MSNTELAERIAVAIAHDIGGRSGLGDEWDSVGNERQKVIVASWTKQIQYILDVEATLRRVEEGK